MSTPYFVLAGLGNPGEQYKKTRHNIGFEVIDAFAKKHSIVFKKQKGRMVGQMGNIFLLKPLKYINLSGEVIANFLRYYKLTPSNLLVIVDDLQLPFGMLRIKGQGSSAGHNGLKNIQEWLNTSYYPRLRIGIGSSEDSDKASYVLGRFFPQEMEELPTILAKAIDALELWLDQGIEYAMNQVNVHPKQKEKLDEKNKREPL